MTTEERIEELHKRMKTYRRRQEKRRTALLGIVCFIPAISLLLLAVRGGGQLVSSPEMYTGSTMLFQDSGGYVLIGVIAFLIGVIFAVIVQRVLDNKHQDISADEPDYQKQGKKENEK